jgi:hypothetical protein
MTRVLLLILHFSVPTGRPSKLEVVVAGLGMFFTQVIIEALKLNLICNTKSFK